MNLSVIRTYRAQVEETLRVELADLQRAVQAEQEAQRSLLVEVEAATAEFLKMATQGMTVAEARAQQGKLDALSQAVRNARDAITSAQRHYEAKLAEVMEASRERKKLEILEEREVARKSKREQRREQTALDEAAGTRFLSKEGQA